MKELKSYHFSNYLFNMLKMTYNGYLSNQQQLFQEMNDSISNRLFNSNSKKLKPEKKTKLYPRKFKSPKDLNYHFKYKAPQFNDFTKKNHQYLIKDFNGIEKTNENSSLNIFTDRDKKDKKIKLHKNEYEYKMKYNPSKISNNFIRFNASKEYSKLSQKIETKNIKENTKELINNKLKMKLSKHKIKNDITEGYLGRKLKTDIPCLFDASTTFYNNYSNKSEKYRHEVILNELNKLKAFINNDPKNKIQIFKNFLRKFNYKNLEQITDKQILSICDFICINDNDILFHLIKPYFKAKDIISDLINNIIFIIQNRKDIIFDKKDEQNDSQEKSNFDDASLLKEKIYKNAENKKRLFVKNLKNRNFSKTQNYFYNKMQREKYKSPFYEPFKSHRVIEHNIKKKNILNLDETNSLLKLMSYQKKMQMPERHFSLDNYSLINEISKEIKDIKDNFDKTLSINYLKKFSLFKKKGNTPMEDNKTNIDFKLNDNKNIFNKTCIQYHKKPENEKTQKKIQTNPLNNKNAKMLQRISADSKLSNKKKNKNLEKRLNEINERMYYKAINFEFGFKQVKELYKITEIAALNFAKKKKFDKMNLELLK